MNKNKVPTKPETSVCIKQDGGCIITRKSKSGIKQVILNNDLEIIGASNAPTKD